MEWQTPATGRKSRSVKEKLFRLIRGPRAESPDSSLLIPTSAFSLHETANSRNNYSLTAESIRAKALMYQRMTDRPK